jgi:hypothetical protein
MRFLAIFFDFSRLADAENEAAFYIFLASSRWALALSLYGTMIFGLSLAVRFRIFAPKAILSLVILTLGFTWGLSAALNGLEGIQTQTTSRNGPTGGPGLILEGSFHEAGNLGTVTVLLRGLDMPLGPQVVANPQRPLLYLEEAPQRQNLSLQPLSLNIELPMFFRNLASDLKLSAENLRDVYLEGPLPFLLHTAALAFLLSALLCIFNLSAWPLANILLCCLAFRGVLSLELFTRTPYAQEFMSSILENYAQYIPTSYAAPLAFFLAGLLVCLYSFLAFIAKRKQIHEN